ncbi:MAG: hypothetical protein DRP87_14015 [Spirochaetes bacterium]|nr:MAG: hypothetical protein DRP87_14015 [Spirochaetota bacterium]
MDCILDNRNIILAALLLLKELNQKSTQTCLNSCTNCKKSYSRETCVYLCSHLNAIHNSLLSLRTILREEEKNIKENCATLYHPGVSI